MNRDIKFQFGKPWLWRGELIQGAKTVIIVEGEPDVISLINAGMDSDGMAVIGLPGAGFAIEPCRFLFAGKGVVIIPDADIPASNQQTRSSKL
jgi:DNA primase